MSVLRVLLAPLRWLLAEVGELLFGLAFFAGVITLTGLADGSWILAALILVPFTALFLWFVMRRRAKPE